MTRSDVTILTGEPTIIPLAHMSIIPDGQQGLIDWVRSHRPECLDEDENIFPHDGREDGRVLTDNELLVELAGRKCYDSFGLKAGKRTNREYIANTQSGDIPHASIQYHAKMTFFIAGVSRRVSQEMMRNYVGADRDQEGSPSQESTRFTHHYGYYVAHPTVLADADEFAYWQDDVRQAHRRYLQYIERRFADFRERTGEEPKGMARKRIYESAIGRLPWEFETSYIWTTNPVAIAKFTRERDNEAADLEIQRFAKTWKRVCMTHWPNCFPQPWMHT